MRELVSETVFEFLKNRERIQDIMQAIKARRDNGKKVPVEWLDELVRRWFENESIAQIVEDMAAIPVDPA